MNNPEQNKKDQKDKDFPGYPAYPPSEDITKQGSKVQAEEYGTIHTPVRNATGEATEQRADIPAQAINASDSLNPDTDVTPEDVAMLSAAEQNRNMAKPDAEEAMLDTTDEDGDPLNEPQGTYDATGADLDVPGSEADDGNEDIGEEDEENNYYSLGGDNHENLEEDSAV
jgi:hypothetical protein